MMAFFLATAFIILVTTKRMNRHGISSTATVFLFLLPPR